MLGIVLSWLPIAFSTFITGYALARLLASAFGVPAGKPLHFAFYCMLGFAACNTLSNLLSLFIPISLWVSGGLTAASVGLAFYYRSSLGLLLGKYASDVKNTHPAAFAVFILAAGTVLLKASGVSEIYDQGGYYFTSIWAVERYGTVPGLGNLHGHNALNSAWMALSALWGFADLHNGSGWYLNNGLLVLINLCLWLTGFSNALKGRARFSDLVLLLFPAFLMRNLITAPSADLPSSYACWCVLTLLLQKHEDPSDVPFDLQAVTIAVLATYACTVKITMAPLAIPVGYFLYLLAAGGKWKQAAGLATLCAVIAGTWVARNIMLSGYLVFPMPELGILPFDWKVPVSMAESTRSKSNYVALPSHWLHPSGESLRLWWQSLQGKDRFILVGTAALTLLQAGLALFSRKGKKEAAASAKTATLSGSFASYAGKTTVFNTLWYTTVLAGLFFWWASIPELRFGMGFILPLFTAGLAGLVMALPQKFRVVGVYALCLLSLLLTAQGTLKSYHETTPLSAFLMKPAGYAKFNTTYTEEQAANFRFNRPRTYTNPAMKGQPVFCWTTPWPCLYLDSTRAAHLKMRGPDFNDGFRTEGIE